MCPIELFGAYVQLEYTVLNDAQKSEYLYTDRYRYRYYSNTVPVQLNWSNISKTMIGTNLISFWVISILKGMSYRILHVLCGYYCTTGLIHDVQNLYRYGWNHRNRTWTRNKIPLLFLDCSQNLGAKQSEMDDLQANTIQVRVCIKKNDHVKCTKSISPKNVW